MQANQMTTDSTSVINTEQTLAALGKLFQQAGETAEHNRLIESLKQSRMNVEAEATTTGQMHLQRMLAEEPDYELLCKIIEQAASFFDDDESVDLSQISDTEFSNDLDYYPPQLRYQVLSGFFSEALKIHREVLS